MNKLILTILMIALYGCSTEQIKTNYATSYTSGFYRSHTPGSRQPSVKTSFNIANEQS